MRDVLTRRRVALLLVTALVATLAWPRRAPADIQEQRRRLPPPVDAQSCTDDVAGHWRAQPWYPDGPLWMIFDLHLERVPGDPHALRGTMHVDYWRGDSGDPAMLSCDRVGYRKALEETITGTLDGTHVVLSSTEWHQVPGGCLDVGSYILDGFDGRLDLAQQEMQTRLVGPGGIGDQEPAIFRRIECPGLPPGVIPPVAPPPPPPPVQASRGCGC